MRLPLFLVFFIILGCNEQVKSLKIDDAKFIFCKKSTFDIKDDYDNGIAFSALIISPNDKVVGRIRFKDSENNYLFTESDFSNGTKFSYPWFTNAITIEKTGIVKGSSLQSISERNSGDTDEFYWSTDSSYSYYTHRLDRNSLKYYYSIRDHGFDTVYKIEYNCKLFNNIESFESHASKMLAEFSILAKKFIKQKESKRKL